MFLAADPVGVVSVSTICTTGTAWYYYNWATSQEEKRRELSSRGKEEEEGIENLCALYIACRGDRLLYRSSIHSCVDACTYEIEIYGCVDAYILTSGIYKCVDAFVYAGIIYGYVNICMSRNICKLRRALYGLKQTPRAWYQTLASYLAELGFKPLHADASIFIDGEIIVAIYVDNLLIIGKDQRRIRRIKKRLNQQFRITNLRPCAYYLSMSITRNCSQRRLQLRQTAYIKKIIKEFNMENCKIFDIPINSNLRLDSLPTDYNTETVFRKRYQSAVGSLMYAMLGTRPDIAFAVSVASRYAANPTDTH